jgi:hypothetical protein
MSKLSPAERTKRALLAEHVENQIFANLDELERLSNSSDNDRGEIDDDEGQTTRDEQQGQAKAIISQTRLLRRQYDELVSGKGSTILNAMEAAMMESDTDGDSVLGRDGIHGRYE